MTDDIRLRIGQRITALRTEKKLTQQQLADAANITRTHLSRIESGKYAVKIDVLEAIAHALDTHVELINN